MDGGRIQTASILIRTSSSAGSLLLRLISLSMLAALAVCFLPSTCYPQQPSVPPAQSPIQATTELVRVDVSVLDKSGNFVGGLEQKDFQILDAGVAQPILHFSPVEAPAQVLLLVETSPAVYLIHNEHLIAAYALLDGLATDDQVALVTYDQAPHAMLRFTPDKSELAAALGQIQYTLGNAQLNFFDSISAVLDWLAPIHGKKALVILSTGLDSSPHSRWDALEEKLRGNDVVIFPVALGGTLRQPAGKKQKSSKNARKTDAQPQEAPPEQGNPLSFEKADTALRSLAKITGGRAYFPLSAKEFVPMYREIAAALRHQYVLGFLPAQDGRFHALTVQVGDSGGQPAVAGAKSAGYRVFAREGYLAPGP
jgi:VWFA-related protein